MGTNYASKVIKVALAEVGYLEKGSNSNLDSKTGNAGYRNYTKYSRDFDKNYPTFYNGKKSGAEWCDIFVDWCMVKAFGVETALKLLGQPKKSCGAGCSWSAGYYQKIPSFYRSPKVGDQIFFRDSSGSPCHTGLVYKVDSTYVYTIEGNTSSTAGVVANGGCVAKKKYKLTSSYIYGYGRPKYDAEPKKTTAATTTTTTAAKTYSKTQFIKDVQKATGSKVDGIAGPETLRNTVTVSRYKNSRHAVVKAIQKRLNALGYNCGTADGIAGVKFDAAVKKLQKANGCYVDGEVTARNKTWKKLLGLL